MGVGDEDRRQVFRLDLDLREVVEDLAAVRVRRGVDEHEPVIDDERRRCIRLDHVYAFQEFHGPTGEADDRPRTYAFRAPQSHRGTTRRAGFLWDVAFRGRGVHMALTDVLARVESDAPKALELLKEYVRFPTISAHKRAQPETAAFVRRLLAENGFEAREVPTEGGPNVVFGQMIVDERRPTLLMYQHYV